MPVPILGHNWLDSFVMFKKSIKSRKEEEFLTQCKNMKQHLDHLSNVVHACCGKNCSSMMVRWSQKHRDLIFKIEARKERGYRKRGNKVFGSGTTSLHFAYSNVKNSEISAFF